MKNPTLPHLFKQRTTGVVILFTSEHSGKVVDEGNSPTFKGKEGKNARNLPSCYDSSVWIPANDNELSSNTCNILSEITGVAPENLTTAYEHYKKTGKVDLDLLLREDFEPSAEEAQPERGALADLNDQIYSMIKQQATKMGTSEQALEASREHFLQTGEYVSPEDFEPEQPTFNDSNKSIFYVCYVAEDDQYYYMEAPEGAFIVGAEPFTDEQTISDYVDHLNGKQTIH